MTQSQRLVRLHATDRRCFYVDLGTGTMREFRLEPFERVLPESEVDPARAVLAKHVSSLSDWAAKSTVSAVNRFLIWSGESNWDTRLCEARDLPTLLWGDAWTNGFVAFRKHALQSGWRAREVSGMCSRALQALQRAGLSVPTFYTDAYEPLTDSSGCISIRISSGQSVAKTTADLVALVDALNSADEGVALKHIRELSKSPRTRSFVDLTMLVEQLRYASGGQAK